MIQKNKITGLSVIGLLQIGCLGVLLGTLAPFLAGWLWYLDLLSHFRFQYFILSVFFLVVLVLAKQRMFVLMALLSSLLNAFWVLPMYGGSVDGVAHAAELDSTNRLKLFHANVYTSNSDHERLLEQIARENADVVLLQEVNARWLKALDPIKTTYSHHIELPREDNFGIAVYSRLPIHSQQVHDWTLLDIPSIEIELEQGGQLVRIITTHPPPPVNHIYYQAAQHQFEAIARILNNSEQPSVVIGDLNTTVWSSNHPILTAGTGLINAGQGFLPTWPTSLWPLMIPIDQCLVSPHFAVMDIHTGTDFGSDHWPLVVTLGW